MASNSDARSRIVDAAVDLIETRGLSATTTRAVAAAAGVKSPAIYRLFNDMQGLLDAVVVRGFSDYLQRKPAPSAEEDPVEALRAGWNAHVQFGLDHPELYRLMYAPGAVGQISEASKIAFERLLGMTRRLSLAGRLTVDTFAAADMMHAGAMGVTFALLNTPQDQRDEGLPKRMRELLITAIAHGQTAPAASSPTHKVATANDGGKTRLGRP